jgi:sortase (surface protein transpeptidase)
MDEIRRLQEELRTLQESGSASQVWLVSCDDALGFVGVLASRHVVRGTLKGERLGRLHTSLMYVR